MRQALFNTLKRSLQMCTDPLNLPDITESVSVLCTSCLIVFRGDFDLLRATH
jgi:hypothetical protein